MRQVQPNRMDNTEGNTMRPATFSTENPPRPIDCVETKEYINGLRRRIEVQNDGMEHLATQVNQLQRKNKQLQAEIEKICLDLGIMDGGPGVGWVQVPR
jgi:predicted RNase H-like nuclease (RuvC/YqgF family)